MAVHTEETLRQYLSAELELKQRAQRENILDELYYHGSDPQTIEEKLAVISSIPNMCITEMPVLQTIDEKARYLQRLEKQYVDDVLFGE